MVNSNDSDVEQVELSWGGA